MSPEVWESWLCGALVAAAAAGALYWAMYGRRGC